MAEEATIPTLAGVHHLKLPVTDLQRSIAWYERTLGYQPVVEFVEQGKLMGVGLAHPDGGPMMTLRLDPERARAAAGFDYFSIGVPDKQSIEALADRLNLLGERHAGVHFASIGWILPEVHDPDGHEVRFYTIAEHTPVADRATPLVISDARETSLQREAAMQVNAATG
jgi:catechol 2,3-dioxygenase-like lactoylglutathione lyase family enzyme